MPAPGMPPKSADTRLPVPWPTRVRLELCRLRVSVSTTTQVFRVSIDKRTESVTAGTASMRKSAQCSPPIAGKTSSMPEKTPPPPPRGPITSGFWEIWSSSGRKAAIPK